MIISLAVTSGRIDPPLHASLGLDRENIAPLAPISSVLAWNCSQVCAPELYGVLRITLVLWFALAAVVGPDEPFAIAHLAENRTVSSLHGD